MIPMRRIERIFRLNFVHLRLNIYSIES